MGSLVRWSKEDPCGVSAALAKNNQEIRYPLSLPLDISVMAGDFAHSLNHRRKISVLRDRGYELFRRVRGDGNCFYRAMGVAWIEALLTLRATSNPFRDQDPKGMLLDTSLADWPDCSEFRELADQYQELLEALNIALSADDEKASQASEHLRKQLLADTKTDLCLVLLVRLLIAKACLRLGSEDDGMQALAAVHGGLQNMIETQVLPLGEEAESATAVCASRVFQTRLHIVQLDSSAADQLPEYEYPSENYASPLGIHITLLFRPGHYDILYGPTSAILDRCRAWLLDTSFLLRARCSSCGRVQELPAEGLLVCGHRICHSCQSQVRRGWPSSDCPRCSGYRTRLGQEAWEDAISDKKLMPLQSTAQPHEIENNIAAAAALAAESAQASPALEAEAQQSADAESQAMEVDQEGDVKCQCCRTADATCQLPCDHRLCSGCLQARVIDCEASSKISCPGADCQWHVKDDDLPKLEETLPKEVYIQIVDSWCKKQECMKTCRHPGCTARVFLGSGGNDEKRCENGHDYAANASRQHSDGTSRSQEQRGVDLVILGPAAGTPQRACDGCRTARDGLQMLACGHFCCDGCKWQVTGVSPCCFGKSLDSAGGVREQGMHASRTQPERKQCKVHLCKGYVELAAGAHRADIPCTRGHKQCFDCDSGPHRGQPCDDKRRGLQDRAAAKVPTSSGSCRTVPQRRCWPDEAEEIISSNQARPCPKLCDYGWVAIELWQKKLGVLTCLCGHEFCMHCGADAKVIRAHGGDLQYHKYGCAARSMVTSLMPSTSLCSKCDVVQDNYGRLHYWRCPAPMADQYPKRVWYENQLRDKGELAGRTRRASSLTRSPQTPWKP